VGFGGVKPEDVWLKWRGAKHMLGIAEKASEVEVAGQIAQGPRCPRPRRRIVALDNRLRKRR